MSLTLPRKMQEPLVKRGKHKPFLHSQAEQIRIGHLIKAADTSSSESSLTLSGVRSLSPCRFALTNKPSRLSVSGPETGSGACSARRRSSLMAAPSGIPFALAYVDAKT